MRRGDILSGIRSEMREPCIFVLGETFLIALLILEVILLTKTTVSIYTYIVLAIGVGFTALVAGLAGLIALPYAICLILGHRVRLSLNRVEGFDGDRIIFVEECCRCSERPKIPIAYDEVELSARELSEVETDIWLVDRAQRAILEAVREKARASEAAVRVHALHHMIRQRRLLKEEGVARCGDRRGVARLEDVLKEVGVRLTPKNSDECLFKLELKGNFLRLEAPPPLPYLWLRGGSWSDILELRVVGVARERKTGSIAALIRLLGRPFPNSKPLLLDAVILGRDASGPWLLRPPPRLWGRSLRELLRYWVGRGELRQEELNSVSHKT